MDLEQAQFLRSRTMGRPLAGQKALVTGANFGIGKGVAMAMADAGAAIVVNYVAREEDALEVVDGITLPRPGSLATGADVSSETAGRGDVRSACSRVRHHRHPGPNAGLQRDAPFDEMTLAQWNTVIGVNLTGQFLCARAGVREFQRRGVRRRVARRSARSSA